MKSKLSVLVIVWLSLISVRSIADTLTVVCDPYLIKRDKIEAGAVPFLQSETVVTPDSDHVLFDKGGTLRIQLNTPVDAKNALGLVEKHLVNVAQDVSIKLRFQFFKSSEINGFEIAAEQISTNEPNQGAIIASASTSVSVVKAESFQLNLGTHGKNKSFSIHCELK